MSARSTHKARFGPVGMAGLGMLVLGILRRSRFLSLLGLAGVVADVTIAELGGYKAMHETRVSGARDVEAP